MKKLGSFVLCITLVIVTAFSLTAVTHAENLNKNRVSFQSEIAMEALEAFYENKDLAATNDLTTYFSDESLVLLNAKIEMEIFQQQTHDFKYDDYRLDIIPFQASLWTDDGDTQNMVFQVERKWYYSDRETTMSELVNVTISQNLIVKCNEAYENLVYGPIDELFLNTQQDQKQNIIDDYVNAFKTQCISKKEGSKNEEKNLHENKNVTEIETRSFSRINEVNWIRNNYDQTYPTSALAVPYYDFSQITGAYDCTNFVSHGLAAGGATLHDNGSSGITGTDQWYFRSTANRSSSWAGVNQLYLFLTRSNPSSSNVGPYASEIELTYANASAGDIVQGYNGSVWRHSTVVTYFYCGNVYVTGRTSPGVYNDNVLATTIYGTQRLLHIGGNY